MKKLIILLIITVLHINILPCYANGGSFVNDAVSVVLEKIEIPICRGMVTMMEVKTADKLTLLLTGSTGLWNSANIFMGNIPATTSFQRLIRQRQRT